MKQTKSSTITVLSFKSINPSTLLISLISYNCTFLQDHQPLYPAYLSHLLQLYSPSRPSTPLPCVSLSSPITVLLQDQLIYPAYLSHLLQLYSPSRPLTFSADTRLFINSHYIIQVRRTHGDRACFSFWPICLEFTTTPHEKCKNWLSVQYIRFDFL